MSENIIRTENKNIVPSCAHGNFRQGLRFDDITESTPGPIMINLATYVGNVQAGFPDADNCSGRSRGNFHSVNTKIQKVYR